MRFQSLFLIGLILSVIFIFPIVAFADKGEHGKKPSTHPGSENPVAEKAGKQAYHPKKVEIHLPEQANKNAKGNKDKQTTKQLPEQASEKAVQAVDKVKQKNQNATTAVHKNVEKHVKKQVPVKSKNQEKKANPDKPQPSSETHDEKVPKMTVKQVDTLDKAKDKPVKINTGKKESSEEARVAGKSDDSEKEQEPFSRDKHRNIKVVPIPVNPKVPDRPANDRVNVGHHTNSFIDKWIIKADKYVTTNRMQPFVSRTSIFRDQWVNAPPSQPPKSLLF